MRNRFFETRISNLMKTEKKEENTSKKTSSCTTTKRTREVKSRLLVNLLEKKIHYVSAPGPPLQLGKPPRGGRKMAAMVLILIKAAMFSKIQRLILESMYRLVRASTLRVGTSATPDGDWIVVAWSGGLRERVSDSVTRLRTCSTYLLLLFSRCL